MSKRSALPDVLSSFYVRPMPDKVAPTDTIKDICAAGLDLRIWCYACDRGKVIDAIIWQRFEARGWAMAVPEARQRFTCSRCKSSADVLIVPASSLNPMPTFTTGTGAAEFFFHSMRSKRRRW
jgi:hypothetical protein